MGKKQQDQNVAVRNGKAGLTHRQSDFRAARTKVFIQNALTELTRKRAFDKISVQDISRQAMINRATFYRYYKDKYNLVEEIFRGALHRMATEMGPAHVFLHTRDLDHALADERSESAWVGLFEHFAFNSHMYLPILSGKGSAWFQGRMREDLMKFFKGRVHYGQHGRSPGVPAEVARCFFASATVGVTYYWLESGMKHPAAQIAKWFRLIAYRGYIGAMAGLNG